MSEPSAILTVELREHFDLSIRTNVACNTQLKTESDPERRAYLEDMLATSQHVIGMIQKEFATRGLNDWGIAVGKE